MPCSECGAASTPLWRKFEGRVFCNACGIKKRRSKIGGSPASRRKAPNRGLVIRFNKERAIIVAPEPPVFVSTLDEKTLEYLDEIAASLVHRYWIDCHAHTLPPTQDCALITTFADRCTIAS